MMMYARRLCQLDVVRQLIASGDDADGRIDFRTGASQPAFCSRLRYDEWIEARTQLYSIQ